jgi:hypothetical protein
MLPADGNLRLRSVLKHLGGVFEVLADAGLLDMELRPSGTSPRKITLGLGQSIDAIRILPSVSRETAIVVLSVVPQLL